MKQFPFFVYGTLLPGQPNFELWQDAILAMKPARFVGAALYDLDWYPMLVELPGNQVTGLLITVEPALYSDVLAQLDFLEGHDPDDPTAGEYQRQLRIVTLSGGSHSVAWVYVGRLEPVNGRPRLDTNWIDHARRQQPQLAAWWQAVETVAGRHTNQDSKP